MRLKDQSAIVTGAASGFGAAIAERFAAEGARVVVADLNEAQGQAVAQRIGGVFARCDVSRAEDVQALVQTAVQAHGRLDIVVNNAGVTHVNKPHLDVTEDEFDRLYRVNVKSLFNMNRAAVPAMRANPGGSSGVFINVASTTGVRPGPGLCWYSGSKGAVITTSKGLALELARETSQRANTPPMRCATAWPWASFRSATTTRAPSAAKRSAIAAPKPDAAPVTMADLSCNLMTPLPRQLPA